MIVGAGTAGCVVARRLADSGASVLLLEAGGSDRIVWIQLPVGYGRTFFDKRINWMFDTEAVAALGGRTSYWPRGKVIGGSGSINAMVHVRGQPHDYDDWRDLGNTGWGWDDVLPYFIKAEDHDLGPSDVHGSEGPQHVTDISSLAHPLCQRFIAAGTAMGFPYSSDLNGTETEGVGVYQINTRGGRRASTANEYLRPALRRRAIKLQTKSLATRILFEGKRAKGIEYRRNGQTETAQARREIILCGGAINSPQLLQLSGIGNAELLRGLGIEPLLDARAVGRNLQDHLAVSYFYKTTVPTLNDALRPLTGKAKAALRYLGNSLAKAINPAIRFQPVSGFGPGQEIRRERVRHDRKRRAFTIVNLKRERHVSEC